MFTIFYSTSYQYSHYYSTVSVFFSQMKPINSPYPQGGCSQPFMTPVVIVAKYVHLSLQTDYVPTLVIL